MALVTDEDGIRRILSMYRRVAVIGASRDPSKAAHRVPAYLKSVGYRVIPVNPSAGEILGERSYPDLVSVNEEVDIVDVFRPPEEVPKVVEQVLRRIEARGDVRVLWLQEGITAPQEVLKPLLDRGIQVVQDRCMMKMHRALLA
jgi:hypothetical protein